ncbi:TonB-dependent receptor [Polymorphobacter glacialis]|uniref:TonB-dependent receptor n=1 Tax=Sandarakinorhabdus glacialis TaxID=1614636 RepID=A0A916ZL53_9SPHN|nr:TonB-dependent receptor [Polymorphobacter glacialis]GGE02886.1 TonB-dependent receptor [Polymorphobacter glacialis]
MFSKRHHRLCRTLVPLRLFGAATPAFADEAVAADDPLITVFGRADNLIGIAAAASEGHVGRADIDTRPIQRVGELLEVIPGLIATQHSGGGKANQYFLRGFNLDHGTDFAGFFDGVPLNYRSHGHGQGYLDLNFIIPETIEYIDYSKGSYRADLGDFATAGAGKFRTYDTLPTTVSIETGSGTYLRGVAAGSTKIGDGTALLALEARHDDGRYDLTDDLNLFSGFGKYTVPLGDGVLRTSISAYHVKFASSEQVPQRAIDSATIGRLGFLDSDLGGETTRIGVISNWTQDGDTPLTVLAYAHYYRFNLFSNFTYLLDEPINGDEFEQADRRTVIGGRVDKRFKTGPVEFLIGTEGRYDFIPEVGLYRTAARQRLSTVREDDVKQGSAALFAEATLRPAENLRVILGARGDLYRFNVRSDLAVNSGSDTAAIFSPKATIAWTPVEQVELYANYGRGFHSNDARGTAINIDPNSGDAAERVVPLVAATGYEVGARLRPVSGMSITATAWRLNLESELLFVGDGGTTEPQGPSNRHGVELAAFYQPAPWLTLDAEYTWSQGRLTDLPRGADRIPGAIERVIAGGIVVQSGGFTGSLRLRHFGSVALIVDNSVRSRPTSVVNSRLAYRFGRYEIAATILNLLQSRDAEINYFYASRLPGEPDSGIEDIHLKPVEPRQLRIAGTMRF